MLLGGPDTGDSGLLDPARARPLIAGSAWTSFARTNAYRVGGNAILWPQGAPGDTPRDAARRLHVHVPRAATRSPTPRPSTPPTPAAGWTLNGAGIPAHERRPLLRQRRPAARRLAGRGRRRRGPARRRHRRRTTPAATSGSSRSSCCGPARTTRGGSGPPQRKWRAYHSTALLLPDGRVLSAGDDYWHLGDEPRPQGGDPMDVGEIYSPPYLFDGDEPAAAAGDRGRARRAAVRRAVRDRARPAPRGRCWWRRPRRRTART